MLWVAATPLLVLGRRRRCDSNCQCGAGRWRHCWAAGVVGWLVAWPLAQFINLDCIGHSRPRPFPILVGGAFMKPQLAVVER